MAYGWAAIIQAADQVELEIDYGDSSGAPAGLALWQNDTLLRQLDVPPADGHWRLTVPAIGDSFLYVVATQEDGDFAVTAPLYVESGDEGEVLLNEVLVSPGHDHNGDGTVNSDDEYVELYNSGKAPLSLAGMQLGDERSESSSGARFSFGPGRTIDGRGYLVLWRGESRLNLNNDGDRVYLFDGDGAEIDTIGWDSYPGQDRSISRVPDGQGWVFDTDPTPGRANERGHSASPPLAPPGQDEKEEEPEIGPSHGQATGPPGSLAMAKLRGLEAQVEFRAQVVVPPGLFNSAVYVAEPAPPAGGASQPVCGLGIQVYLRSGEFFPMQEGDWVLVRGELQSFRGELEVSVDHPDEIWRYAPGEPLQPLEIEAAEVGESLEGRLVTFSGVVSGWQGDSIYLSDPKSGYRAGACDRAQQFGVAAPLCAEG